jgi:hypothetical protein
MDELDGALDGLSDDRRSFLKKLAIGSAFAVPVVSSFTMSNVTAAYAQTAATSSQVSAGGATNSTTTTSSTTTTTSPNSTTTTTTTTNPNQPPAPAPSPSDVNIKENIVPVVW